LLCFPPRFFYFPQAPGRPCLFIRSLSGATRDDQFGVRAPWNRDTTILAHDFLIHVSVVYAIVYSLHFDCLVRADWNHHTGFESRIHSSIVIPCRDPRPNIEVMTETV